MYHLSTLGLGQAVFKEHCYLLTRLILPTAPGGKYHYPHPLFGEGAKSSEWLRNLPEVTQLLSDKAGIQSQAVWVQDLHA